MAPRKSKSGAAEVDSKIVQKYIDLGAEIKPLKKEREQLGDIIKKWLGDKQEAEVEGVGTITYAYDADKPTEEVDLLMLKEDYPKVYAKVVTKGTKKGARKLKMPGANED